MNKTPGTTSDAVEILRHKFSETPEDRAEIEQIKHDMQIGQQIYDARHAAGLTQAQLAEKIGTTQSVISDLEDAEYEGHSMQMLRKIAAALDLSVQVSFIPAEHPAPRHAG